MRDLIIEHLNLASKIATILDENNDEQIIIWQNEEDKQLKDLLEYLINKTDLFFIVFWILPRTILLLILGIDIFVFAKFEYRYKFLFIGLLLLFNRCFKYSLKNTKNQMYEDNNPFVRGIGTKYYQYVHPSELEPDFDPEDEDEGLRD